MSNQASSSRVSSINKTGSAKLIGAVTLTGGTNVTLTQSGNDISIAASGSGGGSTGDMLAATYDPAAIAQQVVGTTASQTLTNKTISSPKISQINDSNNAEVLQLSAATSAVNYPVIQNAATGNSPVISVAGSDTDINLSFTAKGAGIIKAGGAEILTTLNTISVTNKNLTSGTNTFPTLNQNTTGSAATLTTSRNIDGQAFNGSADITVIAPGTHAATSKATPIDADQLPLVDSAASNVLKQLTWANLKATLKTYFDSLTTALTNKDLTSGTNTFPTFNQNTTGSAATLTTARTIGTLTGDVTTAGSTFNGSAANTNATVVGKINGVALSGLSTGILKNTTTTGVPSIAVAADFPTLNQNTSGSAATVTTNANLTGDVTSVGNATTLTNAPVIAKVLTGYTSGAGTVASTDSILQAIQKLNGNDATNANLTGHVTSTGNATLLGSFTLAQLNTAVSDADVARTDAANTFTGHQTIEGVTSTGATGTGKFVFDGSPTISTATLTTPQIADGGHIDDSSANEFIIFHKTASAVNQVDITNAATGGAVIVEAAGGDSNIHLVARAKGNGLTKISVLRQNITTNTYKHNSVILTGNGKFTTTNVSPSYNGAVSFGITFAALPEVLISSASDGSTDVGYGSGGNTLQGAICTKVAAVSTTAFTAWVHSANGSNYGNGFTYYTWIAVGEL